MLVQIELQHSALFIHFVRYCETICLGKWSNNVWRPDF